MKKIELNKLRVAVTGASSGIGLEIAREFHRRGSTVLLIARRENRLLTETNRMNTIRENSAKCFAADLSNRDSSLPGLQQLEEWIRNEAVDILVNNAGIGSFGEFETLNIEREEQMLLVNIQSTVRLTHAVLQDMKKRKQGGIISISSIAALQPLPYMATYAATKAFNYVHSLGLSAEVRKAGLRVLTVCPGPTDTEFGGVARVPGTATGIVRDSAKDVARKTVDAFEKGKVLLFPSIRSKSLAFCSRILPASISVWIVQKLLEKPLKTIVR